jgi:hypothetical protein
MIRAICCVPVSPLRSEASHRTEMVSQLVFGECCEILEQTKENWTRVHLRYDGYEGWCQSAQITAIDEAGYENSGQMLAPGWVETLDYNGHPMRVPMGSHLGSLKNGRADWRNNQVQWNGNLWDPAAAPADAASIRQLVCQFLNTPYLWGGKTVFGADCSGFTQTVFKFLNIPLLRDAYQQATQGESVGFLEEAQLGDLAFFGSEDGKITHVGILLNAGEIIHSSGKVRIDKIDNMGIVQSESFRRTHPLRVIKRLIKKQATGERPG